MASISVPELTVDSSKKSDPAATREPFGAENSKLATSPSLNTFFLNAPKAPVKLTSLGVWGAATPTLSSTSQENLRGSCPRRRKCRQRNCPRWNNWRRRRSYLRCSYARTRQTRCWCHPCKHCHRHTGGHWVRRCKHRRCRCRSPYQTRVPFGPGTALSTWSRGRRNHEYRLKVSALSM